MRKHLGAVFTESCFIGFHLALSDFRTYDPSDSALFLPLVTIPSQIAEKPAVDVQIAAQLLLP